MHGRIDRFQKLFSHIKDKPPDIVFIGGDILPSGSGITSSPGIFYQDFVHDFLIPELAGLKSELQDKYPSIFIILGNDDPRIEEKSILNAAHQKIWTYMHNRHQEFGNYSIYGYACVPPTPFMLKDWERYDVSRHVDPGTISPEEGIRSIPVSRSDIRYRTMAKDLDLLTGSQDMSNAVFLFHSPPYMTHLDRAALDDMKVDHVPLDIHIGSIAIQRFIEKRQPLLTLHGHVHESARLTGNWRDQIGKTICLSAAHDGNELALIEFSLEKVEQAERDLI